VIVFAGESGLLYRVSAEGGPPSAVTALDRAQAFHAWPHFLPDGTHFLYLSISNDLQSDGIYVGSLNSNDRKRLVTSHWMPAYAPAGDGHGGYLLFLHEGTLLAQSFDPNRLTLSGELLAVAEKAGSANPIETAFFSVSDNGVLVYRRTDDYSNRQLAWYGRSGRPIEGVDQPGHGIFPSLSPDGKRLAVARQAPEGLNIWLLELARKTASRFTFRATTNFAPVWSPDGSRIVFAANLGSTAADLYQKFSSGEKEEELLLRSSYNKWPWDWSRDGRFISYASGGSMKEDLWILPLDGDRKPFVFLQTPFSELGGMFSPDGKWIAYTSDVSGRWEVYVKSFNQGLPTPAPVPPGRLQISTTGGFQPVWRRDGKELFYISIDGKLMAVDVKTGTQLVIGSPKVLFQARGQGTSARCNNCEAAFSGQAAPHEYAATADGQRFLVNTVTGGETPITVMVNWAARLKR
jgi:Tol biopolymer transport system component